MRAKSHDQRKGQWIINKIRGGKDFKKIKSQEQEKILVEMHLWFMENDEFDDIMEEYNK